MSNFTTARTQKNQTPLPPPSRITRPPCSFFQILPSARRRLHPGPMAWLEASLRATRTPRHRWASSVSRSSSASTWLLPTAWCTTRRSTWLPRPPCPTWAWTWASRRRWGRCPASRITSPCPSTRSRCGAALCCRPPPRCPPTTARRAASRTCGYAPSSMPLHSASTPCPIRRWLWWNRTHSAKRTPLATTRIPQMSKIRVNEIWCHFWAIFFPFPCITNALSIFPI